MPINVAIVEDDARLRESLAVLINGTDELRCVGTYPNAESALEEMPSNWPDVLLSDINLPRMSGIECVARLKELRPALQVIMLTICADDQQIFESLQAGATGYLIKKTPPAKILEAIGVLDGHRKVKNATACPGDGFYPLIGDDRNGGTIRTAVALPNPRLILSVPMPFPGVRADTCWGPNRIDVVYRGSGNKIYQKYYANGNWGGPTDLGDDSTSDPGISSGTSGRLDIYIRGTDNALKHKYYNGTWSAWENLGGGLY